MALVAGGGLRKADAATACGHGADALFRAHPTYRYTKAFDGGVTRLRRAAVALIRAGAIAQGRVGKPVMQVQTYSHTSMHNMAGHV